MDNQPRYAEDGEAMDTRFQDLPDAQRDPKLCAARVDTVGDHLPDDLLAALLSLFGKLTVARAPALEPLLLGGAADEPAFSVSQTCACCPARRASRRPLPTPSLGLLACLHRRAAPPPALQVRDDLAM